MSRSARASSSVRALSLLALVAVGLGSGSCLNPIQLEPADHTYRAVIRWTSHGIPHILADDIPSALYGQGFAFAQLNGCILADQILKVRSERAMMLGPGENDEHVRSDLVHKALRVYEKAETGYPEQSEEIRSFIEAYATGYNDFITQRGTELPCGEEPWLRPITPVDLMAHYIELGMVASSRQAHQMIYDAQPPTAGLEREQPEGSLGKLRERPGSNGWGIGRERSSNGHGMLIANPHFPWEGELKLYESHLRVPGQLDVYGASLMGVVGILIGFNEEVAWTHTVSDGQRLVVYKLELDPSDATAYMYEGQSRPMESDSYEVQVLGDDGELSTRSRTFYRTHHGLMAALPQVGQWTTTDAFALRDANDNNQNLIPQFLGMNRARSMDEFQQVHEQIQGIPWVNTMSTSRDGRAWYVDATPTPNLSQAAIDRWLVDRQNDFFTIALDGFGLVLLPGNVAESDWIEDPAGARDPGLIPVSKVPQIERADFVFNSNDSHWMTNPLAPLTGFSPLHGFEQTPRSPRSRMNAAMLLPGENGASGDDDKFDLTELRDAILSNRGMVAELLRDEVVARCQDTPAGVFEGQTVDLAAACDALAGWDLRLDLDSRGAVVWREFLGDFDAESLDERGSLFAEPFDPGSAGDATSAVWTPRGLATPAEGASADRVLDALAGAVTRLGQAGIPVDAALRDVQYTVRADQRIPIHGGGRNEGVANLIIYSQLKSTVPESLPRGEVINASTDLTSDGYVINYGSSFVMAMQFTDDSPEAYAFVTYGQSDDPASTHHVDQTRRFSDKDWREVLYTEEAIELNEDLEVEVIFGFAGQ